LSEISEVIGREEFDNAHKLLTELEKKIGEDPEIIRLTTLMSLLEGDD
jgi:hypothetical protein